MSFGINYHEDTLANLKADSGGECSKVARFPCKETVVSSILTVSTIFKQPKVVHRKTQHEPDE